MDINTLASQSPQILSVINAIKNDPNLLSEIKENPQAALSKIGVELNEEELSMIQKLESLSELKDEIEGIFSKIKGLFGFKDPN